MEWFMAIVLWFAGTVPAVFPAPEFRVDLRKTGDAVEITSTRSSAIIAITSKTGIGGAAMIRTGEKWPARITIRLNLTNLESFEMENGVIYFNTSLKSPKQVPYWRVSPKKEPAKSPAGTLDISMASNGKIVKILVPKEMLEGNPQEIRFEWIDEFRD
ncbi:MAG: hypothetical protein Q7U02_04350 [Desulfosalsimonadaceae bacterium]|nr:hypothetical protein [Desulfosalsimonadaceae bacterium]